MAREKDIIRFEEARARLRAGEQHQKRIWQTRRGRRRAGSTIGVAICMGFAITGQAFIPSGSGQSALVSQTVKIEKVSARFSICRGSVRKTCVVDGDTIWYRGEKIRLAGINAPEVTSPKCAREKALGRDATRRLAGILSSKVWQINRVGVDRYGRTLANLRSGGMVVGELLINEGLAHVWRGYKQNWCA